MRNQLELNFQAVSRYVFHGRLFDIIQIFEAAENSRKYSLSADIIFIKFSACLSLTPSVRFKKLFDIFISSVLDNILVESTLFFVC